MPAEKQTWNCKIIHLTSEPMQWPVHDDAVLQQMLEHCRNAAPYNQPFDPDAREGYNGVQLFNAEESYTAFIGKLTHRHGTHTETLTDLGRKLEKLVLLNAPEPFRQQAMLVLTIDFD